MKNEVIYLIVSQKSKDADGFEIVSETYNKVMAEVKSTKYTEFYQASELGIKAAIVVSVNEIDYDSATIKIEVPIQVVDASGNEFTAYKKTVYRPEQVDYDGVRYNVVRTYRIKKEKSIELTLSEVE